jgi:hypothetical protein
MEGDFCLAPPLSDNLVDTLFRHVEGSDNTCPYGSEIDLREETSATERSNHELLDREWLNTIGMPRAENPTNHEAGRVPARFTSKPKRVLFNSDAFR